MVSVPRSVPTTITFTNKYSLIITFFITIVTVGYLEQQNIIPQENYFTSIVALIVVFILIGTLAINITFFCKN